MEAAARDGPDKPAAPRQQGCGAAGHLRQRHTRAGDDGHGPTPALTAHPRGATHQPMVSTDGHRRPSPQRRVPLATAADADAAGGVVLWPMVTVAPRAPTPCSHARPLLTAARRSAAETRPVGGVERFLPVTAGRVARAGREGEGGGWAADALARAPGGGTFFGSRAPARRLSLFLIHLLSWFFAKTLARPPVTAQAVAARWHRRRLPRVRPPRAPTDICAGRRAGRGQACCQGGGAPPWTPT